MDLLRKKWEKNTLNFAIVRNDLRCDSIWIINDSTVTCVCLYEINTSRHTGAYVRETNLNGIFFQHFHTRQKQNKIMEFVKRFQFCACFRSIFLKFHIFLCTHQRCVRSKVESQSLWSHDCCYSYPWIDGVLIFDHTFIQYEIRCDQHEERKFISFTVIATVGQFVCHASQSGSRHQNSNSAYIPVWSREKIQLKLHKSTKITEELKKRQSKKSYKLTNWHVYRCKKRHKCERGYYRNPQIIITQKRAYDVTSK